MTDEERQKLIGDLLLMGRNPALDRWPNVFHRAVDEIEQQADKIARLERTINDQPVAWRIPYNLGATKWLMTDQKDIADSWKNDGKRVDPLYLKQS